MKKQSGFTLIELMVVMAIIAILATAGLSAYTGYIKKARDTVRIADLGALNTIALGQMGSTGLPPADGKALNDAAFAANNSKRVKDPQEGKRLCLDSAKALQNCTYSYRLCDGTTGFAIGTRFESSANFAMYVDDPMTPDTGSYSFLDAEQFEVGNCNAYSGEAFTVDDTTVELVDVVV